MKLMKYSLKQIALLLLIISCSLTIERLEAADFYVATDGKSVSQGGLGTLENPWDLVTAFNHPSALKPGDTLWLRGGTYAGLWTSKLTGTAAAPIVIQPYQDEIVKLDGENRTPGCVLTIQGAHSRYKDLEIFSSSGNRITEIAGSGPAGLNLPCGVNLFAPFTKVINFIVHNTSGGISPWSAATEAEVYGNIIFNNGWHGPDRGHGHGIYTQNNVGTKIIHDNIIFNQFSYGTHAYTEGGFINNFDFQGNVSFNNGAPNGSFTTNYLLGGLKVAQNSVHKDNIAYFVPGRGGTAMNLGYSAGCDNALMANNILIGGTAFRLVKCTNTTLTNNHFVGSLSGLTQAQFPDNTYSSAAPTEGLKVMLRKNSYDPDRAHLVIINWAKSESVPVDLSSFLNQGDSFKIIDVQNLFAAPILSGTYNGANINMPMNLSTVAQPIGTVPAVVQHTAPQFGVFLIHKKAAINPSAPAGLKVVNEGIASH